MIIAVLFFVNLTLGKAKIEGLEVIRILMGHPAEYESWSYIVEDRLIRSIVAVLGGGALAVSGLILQVFFRNPLAGPGVLGVSAGASLGVAAVLLGGLTLTSTLSSISVVLFGAIGAFAVLLLLLIISRFLKNQLTLLVIGLMLGYFTSAIVSMLFLWADEAQTRAYVIWGLGSFGEVEFDQLKTFIGLIMAGLFSTIFMVKGLNGLVLGQDYLKSLGINFKTQRILMISVTSVLAAVVTAYCGPISFIGIAVPQLVRMIAKSRNHALLIPLCFVGGAVLGLVSDLVVRSSNGTLPLNTVTALIGAPVIIWTIIKMNKRIAQL